MGVLAVLATSAIVFLNPPAFFSESRDGKRINDLGTLDKALETATFQKAMVDNTQDSLIYTSLPDTNGDQLCIEHGLSSAYRCMATAATLTNVNGTGWLPIDLTAGGATSPIAALPLDPQNDATHYYAYVKDPDTGDYSLFASIESPKYQTTASNDGGTITGMYETAPAAIPGPPLAVTTSAATAVGVSAATLNGSANPNGAATTGYFRYSTTNPGTCNDTFGTRVPASGGSSLGSGRTSTDYSENVSGLAGGTTYYFCAIAQSTLGTAFGSVLTLTTPSLPVVTTSPASAIAQTTVTLNGSANPKASPATGWFRYSTTNPGTCNDTFGTRVPASGGSSLGSGSSPVAYSENLTGLATGTTYYACAIAENTLGKAYGSIVSFTTLAPPLAVTTNAPTSVTASTATFNGSANPNGFATTGYFRYSNTNPGTCNDTFGTRVPASGGSSLGSGTTAVAYSQNVTGLTAGVTYYVCAIATSSGGTSVGSPVSFTTPGPPAAVTTSAPTNLVSTSATFNGSANPNSISTTGWFRYSTTNPGTCNDTFGTRVPASGGSSLGSGTTAVAYSQNVTGLTANTTYYVCAIAENTLGKSYGTPVSFVTPASVRYWVGGSGNWSDAANHWAATSGGAPAAGNLPTAADSVMFDSASSAGAYTVTVDAAATCNDMTWGNPASGSPTFAGSSPLTVAGSMTKVAGMTWSFNGSITFSATTAGKTITTNGVGFSTGTVVFNGVGGSWTFQDNVTFAGNVSLYGGTLNTNDKTLNFVSISVFTSNAKTLNLGASTLNVSGNWSAATTNYTFNAGTSTVNMTGSGYFSITGTNTFYNLTKNGSAVRYEVLAFGGNQTFNGTLTINGNSAANRILVKSDTIGTARTLTAANVSMSNADLQDIAGGGAGNWNLSAIAGYSGDAGGNSGITFTPAQDHYWVAVSGGSWSSTASWSTTSGGAGGARLPLAQDNVFIDANSITSAGRTINADMARLGKNITFAGVLNSPTLQIANAMNSSVHGSFTLVPGMTLSAGSYALNFENRAQSTLTSAGKSFACSVQIQSPGGGITLQDDASFTRVAGANLALVAGTFDLNNRNVTSYSFYAISAIPRVLTMGSGTFTLTGSSTAWSYTNSAGTTFNRGTSTIKLTDNSATNKTFTGGGVTYHNVWNATQGTGKLIIQGSNTFNDLRIDAGRTVQFTAGTTQTVTTFTATGAAGNLITLESSAASNYVLTKAGGGSVTCDYLSVSRSTVTPASTWTAGANSVNGGYNSGWIDLLPTWTSINYGGEQAFTSTNTNYRDMKKIDDTHVLLIYDTNSQMYARVATVQTNNTLSYGTAYVMNPSFGQWISATMLDATHFVSVYTDGGNGQYGTAIIGTISGSTISFGSEYVFNTAITRYAEVAALDATHFAVAYSDWGNSEYGTAIIGTVSGNTISFGSEYVFKAGAVSSSLRAIAAVPLDATHVAIAYGDATASDNGKAIIGTVSGNTISFGSEYTFNATWASDIAAEKIDATRFVVGYRDVNVSGGTGNSVVGTVSGGNVIAFGSEYTYNAGSTSEDSISLISPNRIVVTYRDGAAADNGYAVIGNISGSVITYGSEFAFNPATTYDTAVAAVEAGKFVVGYRDGANSSYGTTNVGYSP